MGLVYLGVSARNQEESDWLFVWPQMPTDCGRLLAGSVYLGTSEFKPHGLRARIQSAIEVEYTGRGDTAPEVHNSHMLERRVRIQ